MSRAVLIVHLGMPNLVDTYYLIQVLDYLEAANFQRRQLKRSSYELS